MNHLSSMFIFLYATIAEMCEIPTSNLLPCIRTVQVLIQKDKKIIHKPCFCIALALFGDKTRWNDHPNPRKKPQISRCGFDLKTLGTILAYMDY